jgi:hypothetical protein
MGRWQDGDKMYRTDPWMDDFTRIPQSVHDEFASAVLEHDKVVEINLCAMLFNLTYTDHFKRQYLEYLADLDRRGVKLSIGTDCHNDCYIGICRWHPRCEVSLAAAERMLESVGIRGDRLWRLPPR